MEQMVHKTGEEKSHYITTWKKKKEDRTGNTGSTYNKQIWMPSYQIHIKASQRKYYS